MRHPETSLLAYSWLSMDFWWNRIRRHFPSHDRKAGPIGLDTRTMLPIFVIHLTRYMHIRTLPFLLLTAFLPTTVAGTAQRPSETQEVTFITNNKRLPDRDRQAELRHWGGWPAFKQLHPRWTAEFNEETGLPRRAYGDPIPTVGATPADRATAFLAQELAGYHLPLHELVPVATAPGKKLTYVHFGQFHAGLPVLGTKVQVKLDASQRVIAFAADLAKDINVSLIPTVPASTATANAQQGLTGVVASTEQGLALLSMAVAGRQQVRLVHRVLVTTQRGDTPGRYACLVDAQDGRLLYRANEVRNCGHEDGNDDAGVELSVSTLAYPGSPLQAPTVQALPELNVTINGTLFQTDVTGYLNSGVAGPATGIVQLRGRWAAVRTNTVTPQYTTSLNEGLNPLTFNNNANLRERSAYIYVNQIHAHMKSVLPDFTGMDFQIAANLDLTTDNCNAFYDGTAINFYAEANNCRSLATINDVVYHEYGHGINDKFYLSLGSSFTNGAMNEGYADVWGLTLTQSPVLGLGINLDNPNSTVRRYDQDPKVYPDHIIGEVHADGEIIAGAWWDLYGELEDMALTLDLFAQAYPGLQANTFNGNEGVAYRDVLLDVLQADDTDGDITNGTPNGEAIVTAFGRHGITLISGAELYHDAIQSRAADVVIPVEAQLIIQFPATLYLQDASLFYKVNNATEWSSVPMTTAGEGAYTGSIPAQPAGTLISYYMALRDIFGQTSSVTPIAADRIDPGLPYHILVGYDLVATENADDQSELGPWQEGQPEDNAITGHWEFGTPVGSYNTPGDLSTVCQPGTQHTEGGEYCWYTGNAASVNDGLGENDVDEGSTTLLGPDIDVSSMVAPAMSYWRWYTNNPPSGANPNADWWQVYASADGGTNWVPVEDTKTGQRFWRRNVFRVADVLGEDATHIRLKFIASDSIRPGLELDGGSLVEAAIDDVELWDAQIPDGIEEGSSASGISIWPSPAHDQVTMVTHVPLAQTMVLEVVDPTGRLVAVPQPVRSDRTMMDVSGFANGHYVARLRWAGGAVEQRFTVLH